MLLASLLAISLQGWPLAGQTLALARPLFELQSDHFSIYYPAELRGAAQRLGSFAEEAFADLSRRFPDGAVRLGRIPVLLADGQADINGYFTAFPSDRIVIFAAPSRVGSDLGCLDDDLRDVFYHELTHALSLSTRSPFWGFWAGLFGDGVEPTLWTAGPALAEGTAIAYEGGPDSAQGRSAGRAADPLANAQLRQDILEGRFKTYWQASGAWDGYPYGELPYDYGALFVSDLIRARGEDAFAALWRELGEGDIFAGMGGGLLSRGAFEKVYGESLDAAWREFRASAAIREPVVMETERLDDRPGYITALAASAGKLYWADASRGELFALDLASARVSAIARIDGSVGRIDPSPDGTRLLLSFVREVAGREIPTVAAWDIATRRFVGPELSGLREAAYARGDDPEALIAIAEEGFRTDLVLVSGNERRVLLRGAPERSYASPVSPDGRRIYLLARDRGRVVLVRLRTEAGGAGGSAGADSAETAETLVPGLSLDRLRSLSLGPTAQDGATPRLAVSFASEDGLYRLALVEDDDAGGVSGAAGARVLRQETLISGSVLTPAPAGDGRIYYVARFSDGEYPCRYPATIPALDLREAEAGWAALDPSFLSPGGGASEAQGTIPETRPAPLPLLSRTFRLPSLSPDLDAAGLDVLGSDIAQRLTYVAEAQYSWAAQAANLGARLSLGLMPWTLDAELGDRFSPASGGGYERRTSARMDLSRSWELFPSWRSFTGSARASFAALAPLNGGAAYEAPYASKGFAAGTKLRYDAYRGAYFAPFVDAGIGAELAADGEWDLGSAAARPALAAEAGFDATATFMGASILARVAASPDGSLDFGPRSIEIAGTGGEPSILEPRYPIYREYGELAARGPWYAFGELSCLVADIELQSRPLGGPLYFQRARLATGLRGAALGAPGATWAAAPPLFLSSAFGRFSLEGSPLVGMAVETRLLAALELAYTFEDAGTETPLHLSILFGASF